MPSSIETITVRASNTVPAFGRSRLIAAISALRPFASATPERQPERRRQHADHEALDEHRAAHLPSGGTERPQRRQLARPLGDRDREVLKMTNAPTNSATMPNASRKYWMNS